MEKKFWAKRGRQLVGPCPSREAALREFRERFPLSPRKAIGRDSKILAGYGEFGPSFDMQWHDSREDGRAQ